LKKYDKVMGFKRAKLAKNERPKAKAKTKTKAKVKEKIEEYNPRPKHSHLWFTDTGFNILPKHLFHPAVASHMTQMPHNLRKRTEYLQKEFPVKDPAPHLPAETEINWMLWSKAKSLAMKRAVAVIMRARFLFRILLHHARSKRLRSANTEDIFTMEVPKRPVYIVDWNSRQKYVFEAQTLMKDITTRLLTNDGLFENPQAPRNPFTNLPFTQSQEISVWNSIFSSGIYTSAPFALYRKARFCLRRYIFENSIFLKLNALSKTMKDPASYDYFDRMLDFIRYAYEEESLDFRSEIYSYTMTHYPSHPILKKWATLCYKYYEANIIYANTPTTLLMRKERILDATLDLINLEDNLKRLVLVSNDVTADVAPDAVEDLHVAILDIILF